MQDTVITLNENGGDSLLVQENASLREAIATLESQLRQYEQERITSSNELEAVRKEQEDLLILLTDQDSKLRGLKKRLKEYRLKVGLMSGS